MFKSISKQVRPNTTVEFWTTRAHGTQEYLSYIEKNYISTKKIVSSESELSLDRLTLTSTVYWDDEKSYLEFILDQFVIDNWLDRMNHYTSNNNIKLISVDLKNGMEALAGPDPYPNLVVPDTWANVDEFADWWLRSGMPIKFPDGAEVFLSDDATSVALFRQGRFQVELYLIHPNPMVPVHEHPGVEVIKVRLSNRKYPYLSNTLHAGESHGAGVRLEAEERGYPLLAIQHWLTREPTTIASMWKGKTVGPKQEGLIKRFNPDAYISSGYADITKPATND